MKKFQGRRVVGPPVQQTQPVQQEPQKTPKKEKEGCEIKVKKTKDGKKISFSKGCTREQIKIFAQANGVDFNVKED